MSKTIFFAYEGGHTDNRDAINRGISDYNKHQSTYRATTWEQLQIGGTILNRTILKAIDDCSIFSCDLTYLNHNVLFELGYAVGKRKQLMVLLNPSVSGSKAACSASPILKNIGYDEFHNGQDVLRALQQRRYLYQVPIESLLNVSIEEGDSHDLLFLSSPLHSQAAIELAEYVQNLKVRIIQNNSYEVTYQTLVWYVTNIVRCRNILIHLLGTDRNLHAGINAEYSLFAGLGLGLGKSVMLLAPAPFEAPIDYSDILIAYEDTQDCIVKTSSWLESRITEPQPSQEVQIPPDERKLNLLKLGIGYETAEEEQEDLLEYFIEIDTYQKAIKRNSCIITGRKGAGKTALFIRLREYLTNETTNSFNVILKPESDELLDNVERTQLYQNDRSKRALLTSVWRFVFYARVFSEIHRRTSNQPLASIDSGSVEERVLSLGEEHKDVLKMGHFAAMSRIYREWDESGLDKPQGLEAVYGRLIEPVAYVVKEYFHKHKYANINVLADNLDKTWDARRDLQLQSDMILSLMEFNGKIPHELDCPTIKAHTILILRTDIYEYILRYSREPDKLEVKRIEMDWGLFPNRLKDLLEARFRFILRIEEVESIESVWSDYFKLSRRKSPFEQILEIVVSRPRDVIYLVSKLFESALNNDRSRVEETDFEYAIDAYSRFLHSHMLSETRAQFPYVDKVFAKVQDTYRHGWLPYAEFRDILLSIGYSDDKVEEFVDFLFTKDYLLGYSNHSSLVIDNIQKLTETLTERRFWLFRRHRVFVQLQPNRQRLRGARSFA